MKLESLLFCEDIQNSPDGRPHIIGILEELRPYSVPGYYSFAVFATIRSDEKTVNDCLKLVINDSEGNLAYETEEFKMPNTGSKEVGIKFALSFRNFLFKVTGDYIFKFSINGSEIGYATIKVVSVIGGD